MFNGARRASTIRFRGIAPSHSLHFGHCEISSRHAPSQKTHRSAFLVGKWPQARPRGEVFSRGVTFFAWHGVYCPAGANRFEKTSPGCLDGAEKCIKERSTCGQSLCCGPFLGHREGFNVRENPAFPFPTQPDSMPGPTAPRNFSFGHFRSEPLEGLHAA